MFKDYILLITHSHKCLGYKREKKYCIAHFDNPPIFTTVMLYYLQKKRSAHERQWESVTSGEWASGKKWADDAPREMVDAEAVSLINSGACGAFVHGLEDEFMGKIFEPKISV
jgi:hypothetical protein